MKKEKMTNSRNNLLKLNGWIARDKNGKLFFHFNEPEKCSDCWHSFGQSHNIRWMIQEEDDFFGNDVKWSDEKPLRVKYNLNLSYNLEK